MKRKPIRRQRFVDFCERTLKLTLTRAQRVLALVAIDGVPPALLDNADREIAVRLFGDLETVPDAARRIQAWRLGRGSGKSTIAAALMVYSALTSDLSRVGPGMVPAAVALAPRAPTAKIVVSVARELVRAVPELEKLVADDDDAKDGFSLERAGRRVRIAAFAASKGGINVRGFDILVLVLDEAELFQSGDEFAVTDRDSFNACIPRLLHGPTHHAILISTPWPVATLMGELVEKNFARPTGALVAIGTTLVMRDNDPRLAEEIAREREADPENTARERDCSTDGAFSSGFFDNDSIEAAIDPDLVLPATVPGGARLGAGMDLGLTRDSSTLVVDSRVDKLHRVLAIDELVPKKGEPLKLSAVISRFADVLEPFSVRHVAADAWSREPAREYATDRKLVIVDAPMGQDEKGATFVEARKAFRESRVKIPRHTRLIAQLRSVIARPTARGSVQIVIPRRTGQAHGDIVAAFVLAFWQADEAAGVIVPPPPNTDRTSRLSTAFWGGHGGRGF